MKDSNKIFLEKNKVFKDNELNVRKFNELDTKIQAEIIKLILDDIYSGTKEIDIDNKYVLKCLKLSCDEFDNNIHLPLGLLVKKENDVMTFTFQKRIGLWFVLGLLGALLFTVVGATYSAFNFLHLRNLNIDIDGDGVADVNIDVDNDEIADINIDTNGDLKPDYNVDYKANREATFNVVDGDDILNPTNVLNDQNVCIRNCDPNGDGWPETDLDLTGDGIATLDLDLDHDGKIDMNLDTDADGVCDLHCDTNNDDICDEFCIENWSQVIIAINGSSEIVGESMTTDKTAVLEIKYTDLSDVVVENILPDDMEGPGTEIPKKEFTVTNLSPYYVQYNLLWVNVENTFEESNFKYKVDCRQNCKSLEFTTAPQEDEEGIFIKDIMIPPGVTHEYEVTFKLHGTGEPQNYDKDKMFKAKIEVGYDGK